MFVLGTFIAILLAAVFSLIFGPFGGLLIIPIMFGLVFSTYHRNKQMFDDIQKIKEKLGIEDIINEEIEIENEQELLENENTSELSELDKQIEKELDEFIEDNEEHKK